MASFLELALRQRVLVIALACLIAVAGMYSFRTIAIDASETPSATARACLDGKVKKLTFPSVVTEVSIDLQR